MRILLQNCRIFSFRCLLGSILCFFTSHVLKTLFASASLDLHLRATKEEALQVGWSLTPTRVNQDKESHHTLQGS